MPTTRKMRGPDAGMDMQNKMYSFGLRTWRGICLNHIGGPNEPTTDYCCCNVPSWSSYGSSYRPINS
ncbi:hypothetical protein YC2023_060036 [Brassica napus]